MEMATVENEPTVFIIDDDPAVRQALDVLVKSMHLRPEMYASAEEFLDTYDARRPGCMLLDVRMPGIGGLELLERLGAQETHVPVILLSAYGDVPMVVRAMKSGATTFLEKPCRDQQLWEAIQDALKWDVKNRTLAARKGRIERRIARLTDGEREVLAMLIDGMPNKGIAAQLGLSVRTIEVRRAKVMGKMEADSLAELIRLTLSADGPLGNPQTPCGNYR